MSEYGRKTHSDNKHLASLTAGRSVHVDGSSSSLVIRNTSGKLIRIVILTKGLAFTVRDGTDIKGVVATGTPENSYDLGIYCNQNINLNGISGTGSALIVFDD